MTAEQALELIERFPYIRTLQAPNDKVLEEFLTQAVSSDDPVEWVKAHKTGYVRAQNIGGAQRPLTDTMQACCAQAKAQLETLLCTSLGLAHADLDGFIQKQLEEDW